MSKRKQVTEVTISHKCIGCGRCCIERGDISLTPLDVFNIADYLKISTKEFIQQYCSIGEYMNVCIKAKEPFNSCMFLQFFQKGSYSTRCEIYKVRPMACYLYPLRMYNGMRNAFLVDDCSSFCSKSKDKKSIEQFVEEKSDGRYDKECTHIQKLIYVLAEYYTNPNMSENEMFEYLFYNTSAEQVEQKLDDFLESLAS